MIKIPVNAIYEQNGVINGVCALDETVIDTLSIVYPTKDKAILHTVVQRPNDEAHFFDRVCQFVVLFRYEPNRGYTLKFMDFSGNMDIALDEYLILIEKGWSKEQRDEIMRLFAEVQSHPDEIGELTVLVPMPPRPEGYFL